MKILFLSPTNGGYRKINSVSHNGGGWVESLLNHLKKYPDMEIGVAFEENGLWGETQNSITYFPIPIFESKKNKLKKKVNFKAEESLIIPWVQKAIHDFQPDLIQIFGSENAFGEICRHTEIPTVIHLQGFLPAYCNAKYPPGVNLLDFCWYFRFRPLALYRFFWFDYIFCRRARREERIVENCGNFMGRTHWDRSIAALYHPQARYWHCDELLRPEFYHDIPSASGKCVAPRLKLISVISSPVYKGQDLILKTAQMLCQKTKLDFCWTVYGVYELAFWERRLGCAAANVNVIPRGVISAEKLKAELVAADIYIHPSYIDNSPNSLCEAQICGLPVIAANVGGVSSLVTDGQNGLLVPANDPVMLSARILELKEHPEQAAVLGKNAQQTALQRHAPDRVIADLLRCYQEITAVNAGETGDKFANTIL